MAQLLGDQLRYAGSKAWLRTLPDLARTVPIQRKEAVMARLSTGWRIATLAVMVAGAGIVAVGLGGGVVPLVAAVIVVVLLVTQWSGLFGSLSRGEHAPLRHP